MYAVESKAGAMACMLLALVCLGTWPAILGQMERRGRLPQHTYLDYSLANFLIAIAIALTLGQIGYAKPSMPNFIDQLSQDNWPSVLMAMSGGVFLGLGNLLTQYALALVGISVTEVISCSMTVVLADNAAKLGSLTFSQRPHTGSIVMSDFKETDSCKDGTKDLEDGIEKEVKAKVGTAVYLLQLEGNRAIKVEI